MGLDLYLVKNTGIEKNEDTEVELCYGRKTWNIAYFFQRGSEPIYPDSDYLYRVPFETWNDFVKYVDRALDKLDHDGYEIYDLIDKYEDGVCDDKENEALQRFVEGLLDIYPALDYAWEARAILDWADKDLEVCEAYDEAPEDIYLIMSY